MCEYCDKVKVTKWGLVIDLDTLKGIYENHGALRYCVCTMQDSIYHIAKTFEDAKKVVERDKEHTELKIIDMAYFKE